MRRVLSFFAVVAAMFAVSCSSPAGPADAALNLYELINNGEYDAVAEEFYYDTDDAEKLAQSKAMIASLFKEKAGPQIEAKGGIASCEAVAERISENGQEAVVTLKITYGNGSVEENDLDMILTEEGWKGDIKK
jgi:hypothetical protein